MCAMAVCVLAALFVFDIPLRGSLLALYGFTSIFLLVALGVGLLISTVARTQFLASQMAMLVAFLPGLYFSGFMFEVASMPAPLRCVLADRARRATTCAACRRSFSPATSGRCSVPCAARARLMAALLFAPHRPVTKHAAGLGGAMIWTRISALVVKELLAAFRDPRARVALVAPPLIQLFLFAFAATLEVTNVPGRRAQSGLGRSLRDN